MKLSMFLKKIEAARAILAALMLCAGAQAWGQRVSNNVSLNPDTTFTLHGDYIFVGNTNTAIKNYSGSAKNITEELEKKELTNLKDPSDSNNAEVINSSSAVFSFDSDKNLWCENDSILYAYLVWTGCSTKTPSTKNTIMWKVNDGTYSTLTADRIEEVNTPTSDSNDGGGLYACYADITSAFNTTNIRELGEVKFTVANIETDTIGASSSKFSGWNLTIVYRQKRLDEKNIFIYNRPVFGRTGSIGTSGDSISIRYEFPVEYNGIGDIQYSACAGAAFRTMRQNHIATVNNSEFFHFYTFDGGGDSVFTRNIPHDLFNNSIDLVSSLNKEELNNKSYTRGFDLHTFDIPNGYNSGGEHKYRYINKGRNNVTLSSTWFLEHHFITNSIIGTGLPNVPEIEAVQTATPSPNGSCIDYLININTGVNAENLDSFEINVKLPDYTTGISNFQISGELANRLNGGGEDAFIGINADAAPKKTSSVTVSKPDWVNLRYYNNTNTDIRAVIDTALKRSISKNGEPTFLNIKFNSSIPRELVNSRIFEFSYTVCVDSAYYAMKSAMTGKPAEINSQTDLSVQGEISGIENFSYSNEKSVLDSLNNCELFFGFGDGSGGFGGFGGGGSGGGGGGGGGRNGQPTRVELSWEFDGSKVPDSIVLDVCEDSCLPIGIIKEVLLEEFNYNLDSIVAEEEDMWKDIKRDSLIKVTTMSITNLLRREANNDTVFSDSSNWSLMHKFWHEDKNLEFNQGDSISLFNLYRDYCALDSATIADDIMPRIRPIIDMPETYSHLIYYYNDGEENDMWTTENDTCIPSTPRVSNIKLVTPYKGDDSQSSSSGLIKVIVNEEEVEMPKIFKDGKEIAFGDTVQYCLGDDVDQFAIVKSKHNYRIFGDTVSSTSKEKGDTIFWIPNISTKTEIVDSFFFVQRNNGGCEGDSAKFYIQVLNVEVQDKPELPFHRDTICRSLAKGTTTEISIAYPEAIKEKREKGLDLRWVRYEEGVIVDTLAENVNSIEVPIDSAGEFTYGVRFFYQGCESDTSEFILTVEDTARTLIVDTIDVCQYYNLSSDEIMGVINTAKDTLNAKDSLMFFKHEGDVKIFDNYTEDKSMKLEDVVSEFNYNISGLKTFVVRPKTMPTGCLGAPSVVAINVIATDNSAPKFINNVDSVLYCLGDEAPSDMTMFVDTTDHQSKFKWLWYSDTISTHATTTFPKDSVKLGTTITSVATDSKYEHVFFVTRIDSNNCVSNYSTFKVVVDSAISTCPLIIDTTDFEQGCRERILEVCNNSFSFRDKNNIIHNIPDNKIPQKPYPSANYIIEWFPRDSADIPCDSIKRAGEPDVTIPNGAGTYHYCVRQRTVLGCVGDMIPFTLIVHPEETIKPDLAKNIFCQSADSIHINADSFLVRKGVILPDSGYISRFYDSLKVEIPANASWFPTQNHGHFNANFFVQLENVNTHCFSEMINIPYTVNPQPEMPLVENDSVYLCLNSGIVNIEEASGTTTQGLNKVLVWKDDKDQIETNSAAKFALFEVKQKDKATGCEGPIDSIFVSVENSIGYYPIDEKELKKCDGDTIDLRSLVNGAVVRHREETTPLPYIYKLTGSSRWKEPMSDKEASSITESGRFFISTSDALTGCEFSDTVEVVFVKRPTIESVSDTICAGETFTLTAKATDASKNNLYGYFWENESQINSKATLTGVLEKTDSFFVRVVDENGFCSDTFVGVVTVNPKPLLPVADDKFEFCQNTGKDSIQIITAEFNTDKKDKILQWYREVNGSFEFVGTDLSVSTKSATNSLGYKVAVSQLDTVTRCEGEMKEITIVINPEIRPLATDSFATCAPYTASLIDLSEKYSGGTGGVSRRYFLGNVEKTEEEAKSISVNGKYTVLYTDEKSCDAKDTVIITINNKVEAPQLVGDTIVCQGIGTHTLTANKRGANTASQSFLWHNNGNVTLSDALDINTDDAFENLYFLQSKDTVTGCVSDSVRFSFSIRDSIVFSHIEDILSCETHAVNIAERAVETFVGGTEDKIFEYSRIYENGNVVTLSETAASKVLENGRYVIDVHEKISGCKASDTVNVKFKELPELSVKSELVKCQFENLADLKAEGADLYQWQNMQNDEVAPEEPAANERFPFTDSLMEAMSYKFKLIGATTDRIVCYDSITFDVTVNKKPVALKDSTFRFCQNTGEQVIRFSSEYITSENLKVRWYDADKNVMDGEVLNIATETAQTQTFFASLYSADCESDLAEITVVTDPQIPFSMDESVSVCAPNSFDFEAMAEEKVGFWQIDTIIYSFGGAELDDAKAITEQGNYFAKYIDVNGCEYTGKLFLKVNPIVTAPQLVGDTIVCQGIGTHTLTANKRGANTASQSFLWHNNGNVTLSDALDINTDDAFENLYFLQSKDTVTGCVSDSVRFSFSIRDSIVFSHIEDILSCETHAVNIAERAVETFVGGTEDKIFEYSRIYKNGSVVTLSETAASKVLENGRYVIDVHEKISGCKASDTVNVEFKELPELSVKGELVKCQFENLADLKAEGADLYQWQNMQNDEVAPEEPAANERFPFTDSLMEAMSYKFKLIGATTDRIVCYDSITFDVTVNKKPVALKDSTFRFCQNTGEQVIRFSSEYITSENLKVRWYDADKNVMDGEALNIDTETAQTQTFFASLYSADCESDLAEITVVTDPQIPFSMDESVSVCAPNSFDFEAMAKEKVGFWQIDTIIYSFGGTELDDAKAITEQGNYFARYIDVNGCEYTGKLFLKVNPIVTAPQLVGDTIVCQGIGTHTLTANKRGANTASQSFLWHNNGNVTLSDALDINTDDAFENLYFLQSKDTVTGCVSDSVRFSFSIRDSIVFSHIEDILSCETHAVNIAERAVETFVGGTEDKIFEYSKIYENGSVVTLSETAASKVLENGRYVIDVHEKISGCKASDTVNVEFKELPELSVKGELVKCQFENLADLKAEGADLYQWQNMQNDEVAPEESAANERFPFTDSLMEAMSYKFKLIGATTDRIVCYDSITFDVTVNKKPVALKDSTFRFCQNTGGQVIRFSSEYITSENLKVRWYDADKNVMDGEVLNIATETAQTQTFFAALYSADCESDLAEITVVTDPQIPFSMDESVSVCAPNSFDFEAMAKEKVGFWQIDTIIYSFGVAELDDAKAITEQGNYFARYIDVNGCEYTGKLFLKVNPIVTAPQLPNDTLYFCQAKTVQELGGKSTITDGIVEWSYLDEILDNNIINTSFANTYSYEYKVRQTDTLTNCSSDFNIVTIVIESLNYTPLTDTVLCPGETLNLANHVNSHVSTENVKIDIWQKNMIDDFKLDNIDKTGTFIIQYSLTSCIKQDSIFVSYFDDIKYKRTPDTAVCFGDDVLLFAQSQTEDAYKFFWNNANSKQDTDKPASFSISESAFVKLTAYDKNGCSVKDSLFVTVNKRPEPIASLDTTIEYCFKAETEVIDVKPTESNTIRWHLPNGESTVSAVKPSSLHSGKFTYSIVQTTPEGCEGDAQHVFVTILDSISERPVMDTSHYCQNSNTEPLAAIVKEDGFTIQWYDNKMNALPNGYLPNSENVGVQTYFATLKRGLCESEPAAKYVVVNAPMKDTPAGGKIDLCQNTGKHTLQTKGSIGATLNWYHTEIDNKREDSISVSTDNVAALEYTYWVSQSDNTGCESARVPVFVEIHKALTSARLKDTFVCKPSKINYMEILKNNRIDYTVDKVLKGIDKKSAVLTKEISEEDTYLFYLTDGYCDAVDTLTLKSPIINSPVVKVEDKTFCYGDSVSMVAQNVDGVDFRWEMNGESSISDNVSLKITEDMKIDVIAIDRATFCESEPHSVQLSIYPKQEVALQGKTDICFGDTLSLLAYKGSDFKWFFDNDTVEGDKLVLAPQKNLNVTVKGVGNNSCPISENFNVNVLPVMNPQILGNDKMLTRNDTSVVLYALPNNDDRFTYHWSFGDGTSDSSFFDNIEHLYSSELVKIGNPFDVTLTVTHEYGCKASVSATVEIDPNFTIPNTFAPDENDPSTWFMKNYEVQIYDRVGILIYEGNDGWDGTYNGAPAFKDTYFYVIPYFVKGDKKFKTGYITLVREND